MIRKTFGKLRQKPKAVRDAVAFWMAGGFAALVALVWLYNAPAQFADLKLVDGENVTPVRSFFEEMTSQVAAVQESFTEVTDAVTGTSTESSVGTAADGNEALGTMIENFRQNPQTQLTATSATATATSSVATSTASSTDVVAPREVRIITTSSSTVENTAQ